MERFKIRMAQLNIEMKSRYGQAKPFCRDYLLTDDDPVDLIAETNDFEIQKDRAAVPDSTMAQAEILCLYRSIAEQIPLYDRMVFHGAAISFDDKAILFTAPSGTGKSTHILQWRRHFGKRVDIVNGDKPILYASPEGFLVCSTPWAGKECWQKNRIVPLSALCLLKRGDENRCERVDASLHVEEVMRQIYLPENAAACAKTLELADKLLQTVPLYELHCTISPEAAIVAKRAILGGSEE